MVTEFGKERLSKIIDWIALCVLGIFCYLYSIFYSYFAELNIQLPFLDFPVFMGEILLGFLAVLFLLKLKTTPVRFNRWHYLLLVYLLFILVKAFYGYLKWGPLAFRNAALFYYPFFAVSGYYFYDRDFFTGRPTKQILLFLLVGSVFVVSLFPKTGLVYKTYYFTYIMLALSFFMGIKRMN